jgi:lipopolysaccharide transport system ATP-binding protein
VKKVESPDGRVQIVSGTGEASVTSISLLNERGEELQVVDVGQFVRLHVEVTVCSDLERLVLGYGIKDRMGQVVYGTNTHLKKQPIISPANGELYIFEISFHANLGPGTYSIQTALVRDDSHIAHNYEWRDLALVFNVVNFSKAPFAGCAWIDPEIEILQS